MPEGSTLRDVLAGMIVDHFREEHGVDLSRFSTDQMMTMEQYNLFPNITVLVFGDLLQVVRSRPGPTPDDGYMDVMAFDRVNPGAPRTDPVTAEMPPGSYSLGLVLDQDVANVERAHRGLHAPGLTHLMLSGRGVPDHQPSPQPRPRHGRRLALDGQLSRRSSQGIVVSGS